MTNENPRASNWTKLNNFLSQAAVAALVAAVTAAFVSVFFQARIENSKERVRAVVALQQQIDNAQNNLIAQAKARLPPNDQGAVVAYEEELRSLSQEIRRISAHGELKPALVEVLSRRPRLGEAVGTSHGELKPALVEVLSRRPRLGEAVGTSAACPSRPEISN